MEKLSDEVLADLAKLADCRVTEAISSVTQLVSNERQAYTLVVTVIASMVEGAAEIMQSGVGKRDGKPPDLQACKALVLRDVANLHDIKGTVVAERKSG